MGSGRYWTANADVFSARDNLRSLVSGCCSFHGVKTNNISRLGIYTTELIL